MKLKSYKLAVAPLAVACALYGNNVVAKDPSMTDSLAAAGAAPQSIAGVSHQSNHKTELGGGLIIKWKSDATAKSKTSGPAMAALGQQIAATMRHHRFTALGSQVVRFDKLQQVAKLERYAQQLKAQNPDIDYVEVDRFMHPLATANDSRYSEQWHYFETAGGINLEAAWDTTAGAGVNVAVLDTGYRPHVDLVSNILPGYDMISDSFVGNDGGGRDSDARDPGDAISANECGGSHAAQNSSWHGTHVAGTIAAVTNNGSGVAGVAHQSKIVPIRVLGKCGGLTSDIADAMIWAAGGSVSGVPANPNPAKVLNLSLGGSGSCSTTTQNAINSARGNGAVVVVAAGNDNANVSGFNPGNCSGVISVAANNRDGGRSYYSNYGSLIDVAAPGGELFQGSSTNGILSTLNTGTGSPGADNYAFYQGTSMAAPHVAGVAALMFAVNPSLTPDEVEAKLKSSARAFPAGSDCNTSTCGDGIIDAEAAVAAAQGGTPPGGGDSELDNGVAVTGIAGATGEEIFYTLEVPAGATDLSFATSGGTGDADLYVRYGAAPTTGSYDCRPYKNGNNETCDIATVQAGTYHVMLRGYSAFSGVSLIGSYTEAGSGGGGDFFENTGNVTISDKSTVTSDVQVSGRSSIGSVDIHVDIKHTYRGDLRIKVIAPDGKSATLKDINSSDSADNVLATYPLNASSVNNSGNGTWQLEVYDAYNGDTGYIDSWSITFN